MQGNTKLKGAISFKVEGYTAKYERFWYGEAYKRKGRQLAKNYCRKCIRHGFN